MRTLSEADRIADFLRRKGLQDIAAFVLDMAGPFRYLGAQAMYVLEPFIDGGANIAHDLAIVLEDRKKVEALLVKLREVDEHNG
jgi:hypothetical protein